MARILNIRSNYPIRDGQIYIGRAMYRGRYRLAASIWANPFSIGKDGDRDEVIEKYRNWVVEQGELMAALPELQGKDLVCWCAPEACHGSVLIELAHRRREVNGQSDLIST